MALSNFLQQLHDLDRTSLQFYDHLGGFLRGDEYRNAVSNLQGDDLAQFVEYLGGVSLQTIPPHSELNAGLDSHRSYRLQEHRIPGMLA